MNSDINKLLCLGVFSSIVLLTACGGGDSDTTSSIGPASTATGIFRDATTSGLSYSTDNMSGVTNSDGEFEYTPGEDVTFSVGGVTIGKTNGKSVVTPVDLVSGADTNSSEVINIVRFLLMLDVDGNPDNGIEISSSVQNISTSWSQIDFSTNNLGAALASIQSDAASVDGTPHNLPTAAAAQTHLEATLLCTRAGAFRGTFTGGDSGPFGFMLDAKTGFVIGVAYSNNNMQSISLSGNTSVSLDSNGVFTSGNASSGATFDGQFTSPDDISGTWTNPLFSISGSFSGHRIGGTSSAQYRFTGMYTGGDIGLYAFDVDGSNDVTGVAYSVLGDELLDLTGTLSGTTLTATASDGTVINGTLNTTTGTLSGTWDDSTDGISGAFSGNGCQLN